MQTRLVDLVLNLLRKTQYQGTTPNDDELYLVTDDVGITSGDVTNALGYTPYNATNPNGFINSAQVGNGIITLSQDNTTQGSFTTNQNTNATINLKGLYDYYILEGLSIQGEPLVNGAVISGLTESDYSYMSSAVTLPTYWEIWMKFTTGTVPSETDEDPQYLIGGNSAYPDFAVYLNDLDEIEIETGGVTRNTDFAVASNTTYYLRMIWNLDETYAYNSGLNVILYNANKQYIDDIVLAGLSTVAEMELWFGTTYGANRGFDGSIDFSETYINKINYDSVHDEGTSELLWKGVERVIDQKVDKTGDTMTGTLTIEKESASAALKLRRNDVAIGDVAVGAQINVGSITSLDRNGNIIGVFQSRIGTDGSTGFQCALQKHDLSGWDSFGINEYSDGTANFSFPKSLNVDGQWVTKSQAIASNVNFATGGPETKTYSLTSYLPADGATYEVLFSVGGQTAATNGSSFAFTLSTDIVTDALICRNIARSAAYVLGYGSIILPLTTRQVKVTQANTTSGTPTMTSLKMCAYRRIGTNT